MWATAADSCYSKSFNFFPPPFDFVPNARYVDRLRSRIVFFVWCITVYNTQFCTYDSASKRIHRHTHIHLFRCCRHFRCRRYFSRTLYAYSICSECQLWNEFEWFSWLCILSAPYPLRLESKSGMRIFASQFKHARNSIVIWTT